MLLGAARAQESREALSVTFRLLLAANQFGFPPGQSSQEGKEPAWRTMYLEATGEAFGNSLDLSHIVFANVTEKPVRLREEPGEALADAY